MNNSDLLLAAPLLALFIAVAPPVEAQTRERFLHPVMASGWTSKRVTLRLPTARHHWVWDAVREVAPRAVDRGLSSDADLRLCCQGADH